MCTTNDKPFLTYEQQIQKLSAKGLIVGDFDNVVNLLKKHSYFALISGYKNPFKSKNGSYKPHMPPNTTILRPTNQISMI